MAQLSTIDQAVQLSTRKLILPLSQVKLVDQGTHFLKIKQVFFGDEQPHWMPLSMLDNFPVNATTII